MDKYKFLLATKNDINEVLNLYHSLIGTSGCTWHLDYPNREIVSKDIENNALYILKDENNKIICACAASKGVDEELESSSIWSVKNPCDMARLGVLVSKQKCGIATLMLKQIIEISKKQGYDGLRVLVSKRNNSAITLYRKNRFKRVGQEHIYGIDFYCYELEF